MARIALCVLCCDYYFRVMKASAEHVIPGEPTSTVAVKMLKGQLSLLDPPSFSPSLLNLNSSLIPPPSPSLLLPSPPLPLSLPPSFPHALTPLPPLSLPPPFLPSFSPLPPSIHPPFLLLRQNQREDAKRFPWGSSAVGQVW